jgi:hypothetical protein
MDSNFQIHSFSQVLSTQNTLNTLETTNWIELVATKLFSLRKKTQAKNFEHVYYN